MHAFLWVGLQFKRRLKCLEKDEILVHNCYLLDFTRIFYFKKAFVIDLQENFGRN